MRKVFNEPNGVAVGTQPLSLIMEDKIGNGLVPTAVITMGGQVKKSLDDTGEASLSSPLDSILQGQSPCLTP